MTTGPQPNVAARRLAGAVVAALATVSAGALAQSQSGYVTSASGNAVTTSYGECWRGGAAPQGMAACPPAASASQASAAAGRTTSSGTAPRTELAQSGGAQRSPTPAAPASGAGAGVMEPGYVNSPGGLNYRTSYGACWRAGYWTPAMAAEPCDATARASAPPPVVAAAPQPAPAPEVRPEPAPLAQAAPEPPRPVLQKVTLSTDVLFEFNKAELRDSGKKKLDEIADGLKDANVEQIVAIGHADRIASGEYNQKLSEARAQAVKEYLASRGFEDQKVRVEGRGEEQPVTGEDCAKMGPERASNRKLVQCLQPDRRVEIEVFGTREVAGGGQPAAGGTSEKPSR
ncbi:MAG: OmpA family protein [Betaproteobacteria bacterium]